jgi:hypothetical protein
MTQCEDPIRPYDDQKLFNAFEKPTAASSDGSSKISFIGNSLTFHGRAPAIGWHHDHGMAASASGNDYAHQATRLLGLQEQEARYSNFAEIEREALEETKIMLRTRELLGQSAEITVIQLGDNVSSSEQLQIFHDNLCSLIPIIKASSRYVIVLSTWWESRQKDQLICQLCEKFSVEYVYIGDIFRSTENIDRKIERFAHGGVDAHPGDWGMAQIALRIQHAVKNKFGILSAGPTN